MVYSNARRLPRIAVRDKCGFRNRTGDPITILDSRGIPFYDTNSVDGIVWEFNLPAGEYYLQRGKISETVEPKKFELMDLPKPERYRNADPTTFKIVFAPNPHKCTIDWAGRQIIFDNAFKRAPLPITMFVLYHEHAHRYYETEEFCDRYAANVMLDKGYNPSQIAQAIMTLSQKQYPRKEFLIDSLMSVDHYDESINDDADNFIITAESKPVLDGWGWGDYWSAIDWIKWHTAMKEKFGLPKANEIFITEYHKAGWGAASYDWKTFNQTFIEYAKQNGFYKGLFEGVGGLLSRATAAIADVTTSAGEVVAGAGDLAKGAAKSFPLLIPAVLVLAGAFVIFTVKKR